MKIFAKLVFTVLVITMFSVMVGYAQLNVKVLDLTTEDASFYVNDNTDNDLDLLEGDWTFEAWIYIDEYVESSWAVLMDRRTVFSFYLQNAAAGDGDCGLVVAARAGSGNIIASMSTGDNENLYRYTWHHVAASRNSTEGLARLFVDGVEVDNSNDADFVLTASTNAMNFGARWWGSYQRFFDGAMDEIRVSTVGRYDANFTITPESLPFENDANTLLLFNFDNSDLTNSSDYALTASGHNINAPDNYKDWDFFDDDLPLPVELSSFEAIAADQKVIVEWQTASEQNNDHFVLYRSNSENGTYATLTTAPGAGTHPTNQTYSYVDRDVSNGQTYYYKLTSVDINGIEYQLDMIASATPGDNMVGVKAQSYTLNQNYPNPFNSSTTITYDILEAGHVSLKVYNIYGQEVATLVDAVQANNRYQLTFNASNLPSGVYFYVLRTGDFSAMRKMLYLK